MEDRANPNSVSLVAKIHLKKVVVAQGTHSLHSAKGTNINQQSPQNSCQWLKCSQDMLNQAIHLVASAKGVLMEDQKQIKVHFSCGTPRGWQ